MNPRDATFGADVRLTAILGLGTLLSHGLGIALIPAMLPRIADDLAAGYGLLGVVVAVGLVAYSIAAFAAARLLELWPTVPTLLATYALTVAGLLTAATSDGAVQLAVAAALMGSAAPISWSATVHVAAVLSATGRRAAVMSIASGGAALGVLVNGVLVRTSADLHSWRVSFVVAAGLGLAPLLWGATGLRGVAHRSDATRRRAAFRAAWRAREGKVAVMAGVAAGTLGFPFSTFVTAAAIDELGSSSVAAAAIWWVIGTLGIAASAFLGNLGDRTSPMRALAATGALYLSGMSVLAWRWDYVGLLVAAVGFAAVNYPVWGLIGALVSRGLDAAVGLRAVSLGLVGGALGGAVANIAVGSWIDATDSFRGPVMVIVVGQAVLVGWYALMVRGDAAQTEHLQSA